MTKNDIRRIYTEKVAELLAKGYILHPETMSGSQGEMAHIDLTNGFEILRVLIETSLSFDGYGDILTIRVGRCMDEIRGSWHTIWNNRLETLSEIKLAKISDNFYTTPEEGMRMAEVRLSRYDWRVHNRDQRTELGDAYKLVALRWLRRQPRMKTCKLSEIERVTRVNRTQWNETLPDLRGYEIVARGKTFFIKAPRGDR